MAGSLLAQVLGQLAVQAVDGAPRLSITVTSPRWADTVAALADPRFVGAGMVMERAPPVRVTVLAEVVMRVEAVWKMKTASVFPCASRVRIPVIPNVPAAEV
ncbi:hypothetical protein Aros01_00614 [Streptosporangium roseum]|uniref:Uncharacterized protein n=1 Tax=Streptosporangium roseum (strain ATCC 12428 / DSM 43021 / JCM 3005 / KCTC 9067 / NCIMB 10171 / NRRL 2505 / NI 9100) TaxID=479432 RepID=D2ASS2_STRRD|nr:hypothetical protein Sros_7729 [Streptosporangium roseum DSM 43021]